MNIGIEEAIVLVFIGRRVKVAYWVLCYGSLWSGKRGYDFDIFMRQVLDLQQRLSSLEWAEDGRSHEFETSKASVFFKRFLCIGPDCV